MSKYTVINDPIAFEAALKLAKGCYQTNLLLGYEAWSGATLRGKAAKYSSHYAVSRKNLIRRLQQHAIPCHFEYGPHNRKVLFIGVNVQQEEMAVELCAAS